MKIRRAVTPLVLAHFLMSLFFGVFLIVGVSILVNPEANPDAGNAGIVLTCLFGSFLALTQISFALIYWKGERFPVVIEDGAITIHRFHKSVSFPISDVASWAIGRSRFTTGIWISFSILDGKVYVADLIAWDEERDASKLAKLLGVDKSR